MERDAKNIAYLIITTNFSLNLRMPAYFVNRVCRWETGLVEDYNTLNFGQSGEYLSLRWSLAIFLVLKHILVT